MFPGSGGLLDREELLLLTTAVMMMGMSLQLTKVEFLIEKNRKRECKIRSDYMNRRENTTLESVTQTLGERGFSNAYRMSRQTFRKLLLLVENGLQKNVRMGEVAKRPTIAPEIRLAVFVRMMAGACPEDLASMFQISEDNLRPIFHDTREILDSVLTFPGIPGTFEGLKQMADDFQFSRGPTNPLPGCIGAPDGISIKIKKPAVSPSFYWCRKSFYAIPVQAMCDSNYRLRCFSAMCVGSTHDSLAHAVSALGRYLESGNLRVYFWIAGDEAYICSSALVTPVPRTQATDEDDAFDFYHSSSRMHVEQAFGILTRKWKILRKLEYDVNTCAEIIGVAMKLHNFCLEHNGSTNFSPITAQQRREIQESQSWYDLGKHRYIEQTSEQPLAKRNHLINIIKERGFQRPPVRPVRISPLH